MPSPARLMQTPSKAWRRSRVFICLVFSSKVASATLTLTFTVSPGRNSGRGFLPRNALICSVSSCFNRFISVSIGGIAREGARYSLPAPLFIEGPQVRAAAFCQVFGLGETPAGNLAVMSGKKHGRDLAALEVRRPRIMRVFEK